MAERLFIQDVGPRDGLQMHRPFIPTEGKLRLAAALVEAGLERIELSSFVSPRAVPQMADAPQLFEALCQGDAQRDDVEYLSLIHI